MNSSRNGQAVLGPGEGEVIDAGGVRVVVKAASPSQLVCDYSAPGDFSGQPLHVHPGFDETFMVLEGRLELTVRDQRSELTAGATAYVSGCVPHTFRNPDAEPARYLIVCSPGGFEHYFRAVASGDEEMMAAICERFGYRELERVA